MLAGYMQQDMLIVLQDCSANSPSITKSEPENGASMQFYNILSFQDTIGQLKVFCQHAFFHLSDGCTWTASLCELTSLRDRCQRLPCRNLCDTWFKLELEV